MYFTIQARVGTVNTLAHMYIDRLRHLVANAKKRTCEPSAAVVGPRPPLVPKPINAVDGCRDRASGFVRALEKNRLRFGVETFSGYADRMKAVDCPRPMAAHGQRGVRCHGAVSDLRL